MRRRPFSLLTVFWITFCSMICHPVSVGVFFWHAYGATMPPVWVYLVVAFMYALTVYKTLYSLADIDVGRLVRKAVGFAE